MWDGFRNIVNFSHGLLTGKFPNAFCGFRKLNNIHVKKFFLKFDSWKLMFNLTKTNIKYEPYVKPFNYVYLFDDHLPAMV